MKKLMFSAALGLSALTGAAQAEVKILFNAYEPPAGGNTVAAKAWIEEVERVTEGRVRFQVPPSSLAPPPRQWELVTSGVADAAYFQSAWMEDTLRLPQLAGLPLEGATAQTTAVALWRTHEKFFADAGEYKDVVLLGYCAAAPLTLFSADKRAPVALEDWRGLRTQALKPQVDILKAAGAVPVVAPSATAHEQLSSGTVGAAAGMNHYVAKAFNVTRYLNSMLDVPGGLITATFPFIMNRSAWERIPERDQALIRSVSGEHFGKYCRYWDDQEELARQEWLEAGKTRGKPNDELLAVLKEAAKPYVSDWLKQAQTRGVDGEAALAYFREQVKLLLAEEGGSD
ncbi:TRAP transporter substrate-binding protein DctP [Alkalilimnicola sp. S0819]|uniref:TRAP transporter substrate-binding protein DctP n=1 Tax=Alkalilimnicola sp. S0819 TaxID=2613922 RepID=UPI001262A060|nr:TRAP transporter substrate-binding protein DctP [Alkalilimnicola sp. S0819]KAB7619520.1 hypothetical protein F3N43_13590 [Alkalilimnicola sp. S0819]MPQ17669.1 hypothetical protein [Alkalilimnicola sp. S0819]